MIKQIEHTGKIKMSFDEEGGRIIEDTPVIVFEGELGSTNAIITDDSCYILLSLNKDGVFRPNKYISHEAHEVLQSLDCPDRWRIELLKKHEDDPNWLHSHTYRWGSIIDPDTKETIIPAYPIFVDSTKQTQ